MKFLVDMNLAPAWCDVLRQAGWDAVHWGLIGEPNATDSEIMSRARSDGFIVFTHDLGFGAILATAGSGKPSVVQIRAQDVTPAALGETVVRFLNEHGASLERGAIVSIDPDRARVRILPISEE